MRVLIIDDEAPARERLRNFLKTEPDVEIIGECTNGNQALEVIVAQKPDLIFLDIQMPGLDGFGLLRSLPPENRPLIVFVTAYDEYAVQAFDAQALDYLLKPFRRQRLEESLSRARKILEKSSDGDVSSRLEVLLRSLPPKNSASYPQRLVVKDGSRISIVPVQEVVCFLASGNYVEVHTSDKRCLLLRETMNHLEARLDPAHFFRASRSSLIHLPHVKEIVTEDRDCHMVVMDNGWKTRLTVRLDALQSRLL